jgi:hypothetical protein
MFRTANPEEKNCILPLIKIHEWLFYCEGSLGDFDGYDYQHETVVKLEFP